jgi:hypothetical protein
MHHLTELLSNPWIIVPLFILLFGEYIPFTQLLWQKIGLKIKKIGERFLDSYENRLYPEKEEWIEEKKVSLKLNNFFARIFFFAFAAIIVIFLELFWELGFKGITQSLARSRIAHWSEIEIQKLPNWAVLMLFGAPFIFMELIGILALGAFISGHYWTGIGLYLFKVLFFIPVHFVLHVGEAQLMAIPWFKRRYDMIIATLNWFKRSQTYVKVHNISETVKAHIQAVKNRFSQTVTLLKKAFEHEDILSPDCEAVRQEILKSSSDDPSRERLYKKFFDCIDSHIGKREKEKSKPKNPSTQHTKE